MENVNYGRQFTAPPSYEPLKEEMEFQNCPGQTVQSTVVTIAPESPPVRDHVTWSIFNTVYFNFCCLGFLALVFSVKSRDRKLHGDRNGAASYGSTARSLNIAATVLSILFIIIGIAIYSVLLVRLAEMSSEPSDLQNEYGLQNGFGK